MAPISSHLPVLIVGAGPTGLTLARELDRYGVRYRLIDQAPTSAHESRALAIHARTMEVFEQLGLAEKFLQRGLLVKKVNLYREHSLLTSVSFDGISGSYPFVLSLPQSETEAILGESVSVERNQELVDLAETEGGMEATIQHGDGTREVITANWIAGCDGAHSRTRKLAALPFEGEPFPQSFVLADVRLETDLPSDEFHIFIKEHGLLALFGFQGNRFRIIASDPPPDAADHPTLETIQHIVAERGPAGIRVSDPVWIAAFHIQFRMVASFRKGRIFVLGDAAHIHSPAGGQGMNTGIQDAANLAWKLALVEQGLADEKLLDTYDGERRPVAHDVVRNTDLATRAISTHNKVAQFVRDNAILLVSSLAGKQIARQVSQLAIHYGQNDFVEDHATGETGPKAGHRWPEVFSEPLHVLLIPESLVLGEWFPPYKDYIYVRHSPEHPSVVYLVRPDQYVAFRCNADSAEPRLRFYLERLFSHVKL